MSKEAERRDMRSTHRSTAFYAESRLSQELLPYAETLRGAGYERLIPMLDKEVEYTVLHGLETCLAKALNMLHPSSLSRERFPNDAKNIRLQMEKLLQELVEKQSLNAAILPTIKVIPPEDLFGICAPVGPVISQLTDFGKAIKSLKDKWEDLSIFLYHGRARDSAGTKPTYRIRDKFKEKTYRIPSLQTLMIKDPTGEKIPSDFDLLGVAPTGSRNNFFPPTYEYIVRKFRQEIFSTKNSGWANVVESARRTGFTRVDFGTLGRHLINTIGKVVPIKRESFGHLFGPAFKENYDLQHLLLPFLMESSRIDIPVLLVPHFDKVRSEWMFWGVAVDFFGGFQDVEGKRLGKQSWMGREFLEAQYPFPENTFPLESVQQLVFNLGYALRTWAWDDKQPVIHSQGAPSLSDEQLENPNVVRHTLKLQSKDTQQYLTKQVIFPLSRALKEKNTRLGSESQRLEFGISLLEDIVVGLNGDPIATLLRLLPAGVSFTRNDTDFFNTNTDIYGLGIFDENGLFPEIGKLLSDKSMLNNLKDRIFKFQETVERVKEGWGNNSNASNKGLFFNFLFDLAGGDSSKALELIRPVWCSQLEWEKLLSGKNTKRLIAIDKRFGQEITNISMSKRILEIMSLQESPISLQTLRSQFEESSRTKLNDELDKLMKIGTLTCFGGELGEGESKVWISTPTIVKDFKENGRIFQYLTPLEKVIKVLLKSSKPMTIDELKETTHLNTSIMRTVLRELEYEGEIELVGSRFKNQLWQLRRV